MEYDDYDGELPAEDISDYESFVRAYQAEQQEFALIEERLHEFNINDEVSTLATSCATSILEQSFHQLKLLLFLCIVLRVLCLLNHKLMFPNTLLHICSALFGLLVIRNLFQQIYLLTFSMMVTYLLLMYSTIYILHQLNLRVGYVTAFVTIAYILFCEAVVLASSPGTWHRVRGVFLVLSMKSVSVAFDLDANRLKNLPNIFEFCGYLFHVGTLLLGPWIEYSMYTDSLLFKSKLSPSWLLCCLKSLFYGSLCLALSSCFFPYVFFDVTDPMTPFLLPVVPSFLGSAYIIAISFHFSHYYIAYASLATCLLSGAGFESSQETKETKSKMKPSSTDVVWSKFKVAKPLAVEFPTSMLNVVVGWNIPMSKWLNQYVFKTSQHFGKFPAVMLTYLASAMLHGLSFHLAVVLLSLAFYTYVEFVLRRKLATVFNCPYLEARPKQKYIENRQRPVWAYIHNGLWIIINLLHLAYLGSMFASDDDEEERAGYSMIHTLQKWSNLNYFSHIIALACYVFYLVI